MTEKSEWRITIDELPHVSQNLKLICGQCGNEATYDVGSILSDEPSEGESPPFKYEHAFTNYFRCRSCQSAGPWKVTDQIKLLGWQLLGAVNRKGAFRGRCHLFDGTVIQTPAMGEDHLCKLLEKDPGNAFLCTRLGNLFRGCGQRAKAVEWYKKALRLDPGDVEARYHMFAFAVQELDLEEALVHAPRLVRDLLQGRTTNKEDLTDGLAQVLVDSLRRAPEEFRERFRDQARKAPREKENRFIQSLWEQQGDEDDIVRDAAELLRLGQAEFPTPIILMNDPKQSIEPTIDLVPSLREIVETEGLDSKKLSVAVETDNQGHIRVKDRHQVALHADKKIAFWGVTSLRELFRGNRLPPADMNRYPPEDCMYLFFVEKHVLTVCDALGDQTDQQMEEVYATLRRRPDAKSLGPVHDFLWQVAAVLLGKHALSQAEFDAIFGQLVRSTRHWQQPPVSRNYLHYLRTSFDSLRR